MVRAHVFQSRKRRMPKGNLNAMLQARLIALRSFPVNSTVVWKYDDTTPLTVIAHDMDTGRAKVNDGRLLNPQELKKYPKT